VEASSDQNAGEGAVLQDLQFGAREHIRGLTKRPIVPATEGPADQDERIASEPREPRPARNRRGVTRFIQVYY
jgi:hypothetical protein